MGLLDEAISDVVSRVGEPTAPRAFALALGLETRVIDSAEHVRGCEVIASAGNAWLERAYNPQESIGCVTFLAGGGTVSLWRGIALGVLADRGLPINEDHVARVALLLIARSSRTMNQSGVFVSPVAAVR